MVELRSVRNSMILEIAQRMNDTRKIEEVMNNPAYQNPNPIFGRPPCWRDISLGGGYSGLLLLFSQLQQKNLLGEKEEGIIPEIVLKVKELIEADGIKSLSLFSGISGICFAVQEASLDGKRYQNMLGTLQKFLLNNMENAYFSPLRNDIAKSQSSSSALHDIIQGISGIGRYAIENLSDSRFEKLARTILKYLIARIQPIMIEGHRVPGWYLATSDPLHRNDSLVPPKINFNLGLAHGVTGILALLSLASLKGLEIEGQTEAMQFITNWICKNSFDKNGFIQWSDAITLEEEIGKRLLRTEARLRPAWCYGFLGISRTLYLSGKALKKQELKAMAVKVFKQILSRKLSEWGISSPSICHGMAGYLLIATEMMKEMDCEYQPSNLSELEQNLISFYNTDFPFGFKNLEYSKTGNLVQVSDPGFLEGTTGILLTLLHLSSPSSSWHLPLLIG